MAVGGGATPDVERLRGLGVRRISLGGALMSAAYGSARQVLAGLRAGGRFAFEAGVSYREFNALMQQHVAATARAPDRAP